MRIFDKILHGADGCPDVSWRGFANHVGDLSIRFWDAFVHGVRFVGLGAASVGRVLTGRAQYRFVDLLSVLESVGPHAILIVALISFLVGLILAFVGAAQLKIFGAQVYVATLVAIAAIRIMGAMMTGVIMAGRTGAAYAAQIGTMRVNQELDALDVMGVNKVDFLVSYRIIALVLCMPILTLLSDVMMIIGGGVIGVLTMGIPFGEYAEYTINALGMRNFFIGIMHSVVYGIIIALCGCFYGFNCGHDAGAVGRATTRAVVSSIVWMVVATGIITFLLEVW